MQATTYSITVNQVREAIARAGYIQMLELRSAIAARVIDGVRVVDCPLTDEGAVYDWTQTTDELRDGDVFVFANGTRAGILVEAWPTVVEGDAEQLHTLEGSTWQTLDDGKYAAAAAVASKLVGAPSDGQESAPAPVDTMTVQEVWEAAGGNPGIKATRDDALVALRDLDTVCDAADESANTLRQQNQALRAALETLVQLHAAWDKGTAYVPVAFMHKNNAAIAAAREALRNSAT